MSRKPKVVVLVWVVIAIVLYRFWPTPTVDFLLPAMEALIGVAGVALIALWPIKRRRAGKALLRLSRAQVNWTYVVVGALAGLFEIVDGPDPVLVALAFVAVLIFTLAQFVGVQFTTKGILKFELFVPWSSVSSFEWSTERVKLRLHLNHRHLDLVQGMLWRTVTVSVAAKDREPLMELLSQRVDTSLSDMTETGPGILSNKR